MTARRRSVRSAGIDVGGPVKGFHLVLLVNGELESRLHTRDPLEAAAWCCEQADAQYVAVDAPCRWSRDGKARACERELIGDGISCFPSPMMQDAVSHPTGYYDWMLNGAALFKALEKNYSLMTHYPESNQNRVCFETFPHAITRKLAAPSKPASDKRTIRRALLAQCGIDMASLSNLDWVDAALCALCAHRMGAGFPCRAYGTSDDGLLLVPLPEDEA